MKDTDTIRRCLQKIKDYIDSHDASLKKRIEVLEEQVRKLKEEADK